MVAEIRNDILEKDRPGGSDGKFILAEDTSWRDAHQMTDLFTTAAGRLRQVTLERRNESGVLEKVSLDQVFNEKRHLDQWLIHKAYLALTRKKTRRDEAVGPARDMQTKAADKGGGQQAAEGSPIEPSQSSSLPPTDESSSGVNEQPRS
jgi:hypothetical protein